MAFNQQKKALAINSMNALITEIALASNIDCAMLPFRKLGVPAVAFHCYAILRRPWQLKLNTNSNDIIIFNIIIAIPL